MRLFKKVFRRLIPLFYIVICLILLVGIVVQAATWEFRFPIGITDTSGTDRVYVPVILSATGQSLIDSGYITTGLATNMQQGSTSLPYGVNTANITLVLPTLPAYGQAVVDLYTGYAPAQTDLDIIVGTGGFITTPDNISIRLGDLFIFEFKAWIEGAVGSRNIVEKANAFSIVATGNAGGASANVTATVDPLGANIQVTAGDITEGLHEVTVEAELTNLLIYVDDVLKGTTALGGASVPVNANSFVFNQANAMSYIEYVIWWTR